MEMTGIDHVDILVIGGGVVGCAILRALTRYDASTALLEQYPDVCEGTSKANSAIVHTGFDARPGTLEARLLAEARQLWPEVITHLHIPYLQTGALMVALSEEEQAAIVGEIRPKAEANGVALQPLGRAEILEAAPYVNEQVVGGVLVEGEGVIDPFWTTRAYCEHALLNGAQLFLGERVSAIEVGSRQLLVRTASGKAFSAALVINAAGLWADEVARLAGDHSFRLTPRKGEFLITEEDHGVAQIILPVPSEVSKGILVTPIVFGGVLLGPTAEDVSDKRDLATTAAGLQRIREGVGRLVPAMATASTVRQFAGLRAVSSTGDYIIRPSTVSERLIHVAGIRSTGLSASPAIGEYVGRLAAETLGLRLRTSYREALPEPLSGGTSEDGEVVCLCRSITRGEILAALRSLLPPRTLDGLKRRTGAMLGECQGNLCLPRLIELFQQELGRDPLSLEKHAPGSRLLSERLTRLENVTAPSGERSERGQ
uniref:FAD/NAD(P)-binding oxidoreductase n=1 Tax=Thermogemmatispora argillosa TaxID=2045280 RepID=A0A455T5S3_9CHLR|nr:FAD/NAD(P)-binding oxidoreductase [Thermogemmatispora argillosa]